MGNIIRLHCQHTRVDICLEDERKMIWRMSIIVFSCRLTCAYCIPSLRESGSEPGYNMDFALGFSVVMIMGSPVGYPLEDSIIMFLGLALENYFGNPIGSHNHDNWKSKCKFHIIAKLRSRFSQARDKIGTSKSTTKYNNTHPSYHLFFILKANIHSGVLTMESYNIPHQSTYIVLWYPCLILKHQVVNLW